jgi:hypothetical protein
MEAIISPPSPAKYYFMDKAQNEVRLSDLETLTLMVLRDSRPDCYLRRTLNHQKKPIYKLMDGDHNPTTYIFCTVLDGLRIKGLVNLVKLQNSDFLFKLKL